MAPKIMKMLHTKFGQTLISIVLGLGLASIFRKTCDATGCFNFISPPADEIAEATYLHDDTCYKFTPKTVKCGNGKLVNFK